MFNAYQDLMPTVWDFHAQCLTSSFGHQKTEIQKQTKNFSCFDAAQNDN
jgi:hypothetical protein